MQQRTAHSTHRYPRKPDLLWCMDTHPIIRPGPLLWFFIYFFPFEENVIPIMIFPLTSTPLWLFYLHPSPPPSPLLYPPYATTEARQVPGLIREDGQKKWRRRETERGEGNWERHQKRVRKITENNLCWWPEKKKSWSQPTLTISYSQGTKWQLVGQLVTI